MTHAASDSGGLAVADGPALVPVARAVDLHKVYGSGDTQVAALDGRPLGKSGGRAAASAQLSGMSGRVVDFHTAVCLRRGDDEQLAVDLTRVRFRSLATDGIERYVDAEQPWDCAGSFKCEGLGITLFEAIESHDPTALVGLPLIALSGMLRAAGFRLP